MEQWIFWIMIAVVIIGVLIYVLKSAVKVVIVCAVIFVLFKVGFVWSADEITANLKLDSIITEEYRGPVSEFLEMFVSKREENEVIDPDAIEAIVRESIKKTSDEAISNLSEMDVQAIVDSLDAKLDNVDASTIESEIDKLLEQYKSTEGTTEGI